MFRVNQLSKDFGMKSKDLLALLADAGIGQKSTSASLEPEEFNLFLDYITKNNELASIDSFLSGKTAIDSPRLREMKEEAEARVKAEAEAKAKAEAEAKAKAEAEAKAKAEADLD